MQIHALVPVKLLKNAKSRLSKSLSDEERKNLVITMFEHVISVLRSCEEISDITIVTPDPFIKDLSEKAGVNVFQEEKPGYNESLTAAAEKIDKTHALLTIAADLPLLMKKDIQALLKRSLDHDVVFAPSKDNGTNAILTKFPLLLPYLFGENSFETYKKEAQKRKLTVGLYNSETIAFDVDTPEDVKTYYKKIEKDQF